MIWWLTSTRHGLAISTWIRAWLRASFTDRLLQALPIAIAWWVALGVVSIIKEDPNPFLYTVWIPAAAWILDSMVDNYRTNNDINNFMKQPDVVLATRAEYIGGHPRLPHGRFAYLVLRGSRENPMLTITFPKARRESDSFDVPLLDIAKTTETADSSESPTGSLLATLTDKPGKLFAEGRVTLNVQYQGPGGRKHIVEVANFFRGNDEVRNWRNYLVCAQAEADTGVTPLGPWRSLESEPPEAEEVQDAAAGDGGKVSPSRRAFDRR